MSNLIRPATWRERMGMAVDAARSVWRMSKENEVPVVMEASRLAKLREEDLTWRVLDGSTFDLRPWKHTQMQNVVFDLYRHNHMVKAVLNIIVSFCWGDGITVEARHEDDSVREQLQEWIDEFWFDPINQMDRNMEQRIMEWNLWGEICLPILKNPVDGRIRLGWIDPMAIQDVKPDPKTGQRGIIVLSDTASESVGMKNLEIVRYHPVDNEWRGDCFFYPMNCPMNGHRGVSELFPAADWFDTMEQTLKAFADRAKLDSHFIWDVLLKGYSEDQINAWYKKHGKAPKPRSVRAHNEDVEWKAVSPNLGTADSKAHIQMLKTWIAAGFLIPNHWLASGDDANLATAAVMAEPTRKHLRSKQRQVKWMISDLIRFAVHSKMVVTGKLSGIDLTTESPWNVRIPDLSGPDIAKAGSAITQIINAVVTAEGEGLICHDTGQSATAMVFSEIGLDVDPEEERKKIATDAADRKQEGDDRDLAAMQRIQETLSLVGPEAGQERGGEPPEAQAQ